MSEDRQEYVRIKMDDTPEEVNAFQAQDPFNKTWDELKDLSGLDNNFKRRTSRVVKSESVEMGKVDASQGYIDSARAVSTGINGTASKEINPGLIYRNGYGLFDVITPPWNLYELANYYDTSFANHAAIDAKVENIVGLGYDFKIAARTMLKL